MSHFLQRRPTGRLRSQYSVDVVDLRCGLREWYPQDIEAEMCQADGKSIVVMTLEIVVRTPERAREVDKSIRRKDVIGSISTFAEIMKGIHCGPGRASDRS
eukprot:3388005-Amphidinium_carterae.1